MQVRMESDVKKPVENPEDEILVYLNHNDLLANLREIGEELLLGLLDAPGTKHTPGMENAPFQVDTRQFCRLMAPRLSMN